MTSRSKFPKSPKLVCNNCQFWDQMSSDGGIYGFCRVESPRFLEAAAQPLGNDELKGWWPVTLRLDWCGKGEAK